jgi:ribonuclease P protein component
MLKKSIMLKKENRITKQNEFDAFWGKDFKQKKGLNIAGKFLIVKIFNNSLKYNRFGFIVNNKIDKRATERNKIKRRLRNIVQREQSQIKGNYDCLIITKPSIKHKELGEIKTELIGLLKKLNLL